MLIGVLSLRVQSVLFVVTHADASVTENTVTSFIAIKYDFMWL